MRRTPVTRYAGDCSIECMPHEPDDMGGGFPCIQIQGCIYDEQQLNLLIRILEQKRKWLAWESKGKYERKKKPAETERE